MLNRKALSKVRANLNNEHAIAKRALESIKEIDSYLPYNTCISYIQSNCNHMIDKSLIMGLNSKSVSEINYLIDVIITFRTNWQFTYAFYKNNITERIQ